MAAGIDTRQDIGNESSPMVRFDEVGESTMRVTDHQGTKQEHVQFEALVQVEELDQVEVPTQLEETVQMDNS